MAWPPEPAGPHPCDGLCQLLSAGATRRGMTTVVSCPTQSSAVCTGAPSQLCRDLGTQGSKTPSSKGGTESQDGHLTARAEQRFLSMPVTSQSPTEMSRQHPSHPPVPSISITPSSVLPCVTLLHSHTPHVESLCPTLEGSQNHADASCSHVLALLGSDTPYEP